MTMQDDPVRDAARRLFRDVADIQSITAAADESWKDKLWSGIEATGLNLAAVPESLGGAGLGLQQALGILRVAGGMALSAPLAETMLAGWMLAGADLSIPPGKLAFGPTSSTDRLVWRDGAISGRINRLAFGRDCAHAAVLAEGSDGLVVGVLALEHALMHPGTNLAFEPLDRLSFERHVVIAAAPAPAGFTSETTLLTGAAARAMQIAGALERMLEITAGYVQERCAFERTISKFQAVQHGVAQLAGEVAVALSAAESAAEALGSLAAAPRGFSDRGVLLEVIAAKVRSVDAAQKVCAIAHQLHGAIGVTQEHMLHRLSLRALAWCDDYGNASEWAERLGQLVCSRGATSLWPSLSDR